MMNKQPIRLPVQDILAIKSIFHEHFLKEDALWIFGSRVNLDKKGGDIDLYIETSIADHQQAVEKKIKFLCDLKSKIGDQKIDVVLNVKSLNYISKIYQVAKAEGVQIA